MTVYPPANPVLTYAFAAIFAQGNVTISDIHIEGCVVGVWCKNSQGAYGRINVINVKTYGMMDPARGAVYYDDGRSGHRIPLVPALASLPGAPVETGITFANAPFNRYSCSVLISGRGDPTFVYAPYNFFDSVTLMQISNNGVTTYNLRDPEFGIHRSTYDMSQFPETGNGQISFYTRGNAFVVPGVGPYYHDAPMPKPTDRQYFIGPVY
jgi:hypothetical protein